eukprot:c3871_g1_i1.p1 GENE.c3871_g1_i1~~c3871_g1_i1.p1  ORF type:complete len:493 (-),score=119.85 c3871_g1_i1:170-1648(-)
MGCVLGKGAVESADPPVAKAPVSPQALKSLYESLGQGHVFQFEDKLTVEQKKELYAQLQDLDVSYCVDVFKRSTDPNMPSVSSDCQPFPKVDQVATAPTESLNTWRQAAFTAISKGEIACVLLAGGQGTRLGSSDPKGMYNIGLPSGKPLFQIQAEKILCLQRVAAANAKNSKPKPIMWYIMTSGATHVPTETFFKQNQYFGLDPTQVVFFQQSMFPCFDLTGKLMMDATNHISVSPDGNGGIYLALKKWGALDDMNRRGVKGVYVCSVDNVLAKMCDPTFIGYCLSRNADSGAKVLPKAGADEKVGVVCLQGGKPAVVEYSDMTAADSARVDPATGKLVFNTGNICVHFFSTAFLQRAHALRLPYHVARKKIDFLNAEGKLVKATDISGVKMEQFIFDVFPFASNMAVLEGSRNEDFAPVKNAPGSAVDSPDTARALVSNLHIQWASVHGVKFTNNDGSKLFEISPIVSYEGEGLQGKFTREITLPAHIEQ